MGSAEQAKIDIFNKFMSWSATQDDVCFSQIVFRGKLNRKEIALGADIGKSALTQNDLIIPALEALENGLRKRGVLPKKTKELIKKEKQPQEFDQSASGNALNKRRLSKLEQENTELQAKVRELELKLAKYSELGDVINELGMMPR
ncbi:MAG: VPA1267 family protein [Colwellia sp.]